MSFKDSLSKIKDKLDYRKSVEVDSILIEIGLLNVYEEQKLNAEKMDESDTDGTIYLNEIKKKVLSYAIKKIGGELIPNIVEETKNNEVIKKVKEVYLLEQLSQFPTALIDYIFDAYIDLKDESDTKFKDVFKFDWYKTPEQREEERKVKQEELRKQEEKESNNKKENEEDKPIVFKKLKEEPEENAEIKK